MGKGEQDPQASKSLGRTNLIRVKAQIIFGLAEKDLNRPSFGVVSRNRFRLQGNIGAEEGAERFGLPKRMLRPA